MFLFDVAAALKASRVPFAIAGGHAVALHGAVRGTVDLDLVLRLERRHFLGAEAALRGLGLVPKLPVSAAEVFDFREEYIRNRNLIAWSFANPSDPSQVIDIIITHDLAKLRVSRIRVGDRTLPVLSLPDLIAMKRASGRPQDLEDIRALEGLNP
ncbi:MAG: hypothetical protein A2X36_03035 [Elusimicrobia bacterium GWA2_69_24]|nr:MAG: hypothetical protein A2X36_03035 [Elusimicrobia bacterium GWA2_69_24]HBL19237.1 hypothetical protein [Elusimicrobiota bacterium]